ncbi:toxin-antitoxin system HicB family antitoxin [Desulfosporosinus sp. Sb-LF]|nr:toxin-antitoxin system HicB family antitoxin [Desulfosporosinus sp. Sb-LF]
MLNGKTILYNLLHLNSLNENISTILTTPDIISLEHQYQNDFREIVDLCKIIKLERFNPNNKVMNYSGELRVRFPKTLHYQLAENAEAEGTSLNQYILYLLTKGVSQSHTIKGGK